MQIALKNYKKLLNSVQKIIAKTQKNIVENVNREKVVMSWQIGKIIEQHLLENNRADYGVKFFAELEKDTAISSRVLYQMRSFYRAYPVLPAQEGDLSWSHYRSLSSLSSEESRKRLEELATSKNLGATKLASEISKIKSNAKKRREQNVAKKVTKLAVKRGQLFTYKLVTEILKQVQDDKEQRKLLSRHHRHPELVLKSQTLLDCGFNIFTKIKTNLSDGLVESVKKGSTFSLKKSDVKPQQTHTYKARLDRVVDGDTIHVTLDLGFEILHKEILRLAKINAPEANTSEGKKATEALKEILKNTKFLIVKTNKTDVYGRYVADVFFNENGKENDPQKVANSGIYLNQLLLDRGLVEVF